MTDHLPGATSVKQVFIIRDTEDKEFAYRLAGDQRRLGVKIWIAPDSIRPGRAGYKPFSVGVPSVG